MEPISLRGGNKPAVVKFGALPNLHGVVMTPLEARLRLNTRRGLDRAEFAFTAPEQPRRILASSKSLERHSLCC